MVRLDAVARCEDVGHVGLHRPADTQRPSLAELEAGGAGQVDGRTDAGCDDDQIRNRADTSRVPNGDAGAFGLDGLNRRAKLEGHLVPLEFSPHDGPQLGVHGREDRRARVEDRDVEADVAKGVGHLQADVAGTHHHRGLGSAHREPSVNGERVRHRMQQIDRWGIEATNRRRRGDGARRDDEPVVVDRANRTARTKARAMSHRIDGRGRRIEQKLDSARLDLGLRAVRQALGPRSLPAEIERQPADAVVRELVREHHANTPGRIDLTGTQGRADACVAPPDDQ